MATHLGNTAAQVRPQANVMMQDLNPSAFHPVLCFHDAFSKFEIYLIDLHLK